jgi:cobalamin-dependent methionine synthase I
MLLGLGNFASYKRRNMLKLLQREIRKGGAQIIDINMDEGLLMVFMP